MKFWLIEIIVGIAVPLYLLVKYDFQAQRVFQASLLAITGILLMRIDFVMVGQIIPLQIIEGVLVKGYNTYLPGWSEWAVIIGAVGMAVFLYMTGESFFKLDVFVKESEKDMISGRNNISS